MPDFKVLSSSEKKRFEGKQGGTFVVYTLGLENGADTHGNVELVQKDSTPAPQEGQVLSGALETTDYGLKLKKEQKANWGGGGGGRPKDDPEVQARIIRQHSQSRALQYAELQASRGKLPDDFKLTDLEPIIRWFFDDAQAAKPAVAPKPRRDVERTGRSDIPVDMPAPVAAGDGSTVVNG